MIGLSIGFLGASLPSGDRWWDEFGSLQLGAELGLVAAFVALPACIALCLFQAGGGAPLVRKLRVAATLCGVFLALCGLTRLGDLVAVWPPDGVASGFAKLVTAGVAVAALAALWRTRNLMRYATDKAAAPLGPAEPSQLLAALVDQCAEAIVFVNSEGIICTWNRAATRLFGTRPFDAIGRPARSVLGESIAAHCNRWLLPAPGSERLDTVWQGRGEPLELQLTLSTVVSGEGGVMGTSLIARDTTAPQAVQRALEASENRLRENFEKAPVGIAHVGLDGSWLRVNEHLCHLLGYAPEELIGLKVSEMTHPEDARKEQALQARALNGEIPGYTLDRRYRHRSGEFIWGRLEVTLVPGGGGESPYFITATVDITGLQRAQGALERQRSELEAANKELEAFNYTVSHDLRAPLRAVSGFSQILEEDHGEQLGEEGMRLVGVVRRSAERMGALLDDLLRFSQLGRQRLECGVVDMDQIARASFAAALAEMPDQAIELEIEELPQISGDSRLLRQVWINLASNAVKYTSTRKPAVIHVWSECTADETRFFVRDNGVGFDNRFVDKLFGVFERLHRDNEFEGTGVGLAIVARIVERHGGRVTAKGAVDEGAEFSFVLPGSLSASANCAA